MPILASILPQGLSELTTYFMIAAAIIIGSLTFVLVTGMILGVGFRFGTNVASWRRTRQKMRIDLECMRLEASIEGEPLMRRWKGKDSVV
jgi:hypothetical protein